MVDRIRESFTMEKMIQFGGAVLLCAAVVWSNRDNIRAERDARESAVLLIQQKQATDEAIAKANWERQYRINQQFDNDLDDQKDKLHTIQLTVQEASNNYKFIGSTLASMQGNYKEMSSDVATFKAEFTKFAATVETTTKEKAKYGD